MEQRYANGAGFDRFYNPKRINVHRRIARLRENACFGKATVMVARAFAGSNHGSIGFQRAVKVRHSSRCSEIKQDAGAFSRSCS